MMLAAKPQLPSDFEATAWGKLKEAVTAIHAKRPVSYSFEELYKVGVLLCLEALAVHEKHPTIHKMIKTSRFCAWLCDLGSSSSECGFCNHCACNAKYMQDSAKMAPCACSWWRICACTRWRGSCTATCSRSAMHTSAASWRSWPLTKQWTLCSP